MENATNVSKVFMKEKLPIETFHSFGTFLSATQIGLLKAMKREMIFVFTVAKGGERTEKSKRSP